MSILGRRLRLRLRRRTLMENNMNPNNGQFNANNGQFNQNNGQFNQNNGQFNANNGQFNQNNGQFGGNGFNQYRAPIRRREIALCIIFSLLTCGIYGIYWMYKMGERLDRVTGKSNTGILYIVLTFLGLGIVSYALMQDTLNNYADM